MLRSPKSPELSAGAVRQGVVHRYAAALIVLSLLAGCASISPSPHPSGSEPPSPDPAFYLRAWTSQALPPDATFAWGPMLTIVDRTLIDGNIAVDAMFPGPLLINPLARWISDAGIIAIVDEASRLGLLGERTDFSGGEAMPGSRLGHVEMMVDGRSFALTGNPDESVACGAVRCTADPGTPAAFAVFWSELASVQMWLEGELGAPVSYEPERVALRLTAPAAPDPDFSPAPVPWPFDTPLNQTGVDFAGSLGDRCVTVSGDALVALLPILRGGNQLTVLIDSSGAVRAPLPRVLVPLEPSPCAD